MTKEEAENALRMQIVWKVLNTNNNTLQVKNLQRYLKAHSDESSNKFDHFDYTPSNDANCKACLT